MGASEQKFKVGDRVRRIEESMWPTQYGVVGEEYTVLGFTGTGALVIWEGCKGASQSAFELVTPAAAEWQPKVGDRVRVIYGHGWNGEGVVSKIAGLSNILVDLETGEHAGSRGGFDLSKIEPLPVAEQPAEQESSFKIGDRVNWTRARGEFDGSIIEAVDSIYDFVIRAQNGNFTYARADELEPAPLRIEAGKFYRTRDGRKVGPMVQKEGYLYCDGWHYGEDGHCGYEGGSIMLFPESDLIAKWIDEPAAPVAATASNDNAAPKFKVGDVVTGKDCIGSPISGAITYVDENDDNIPYSIDGRWCRESDIHLSPTVAPQQSASTAGSTAGFTIPLVDEEPANDNTLTVTLCLDADEFHEELDQIIAKLEKIVELKRQVGLAA